MFSVGEVFGKAWQNFKDNMGVSLIAAFAYFSLTGIINIFISVAGTIVIEITGGNFVFQVLDFVFQQVVSVVVTAYFMKGFLVFSLRIIRGEPGRVEDLFARNDLYFPMLLAMILITIGTMVGLIFLIIPGLLFMLFTSFTYWFVIDEEMEPIAAMKASFTALKPNIWPYILYGFLSICVYLLGFLACCVGIFVAFPVTFFAMGHIYLAIKDSGGTTILNPNGPPKRFDEPERSITTENPPW